MNTLDLMKHVTLPTDYCMQTYLQEVSSDGGEPMGGCLDGTSMASNTPTHGTLQKAEREQKEQANANVPPPSCNACSLY